MSNTAPTSPGRANSIMSVVIMLVIIGFSWRSCWYATPLSDADMNKYLSGQGSDSQIHKALSQFKKRADEDDPHAKDWYTSVAKLTKHKTQQIRSTAAWAMGAVPTCQEFVSALIPMLQDEALQVRYNAAVSLGAAGHQEARATLRLMLDSQVLKAEISGTVEQPRAQGEHIRNGQIIARLKPKDGKKFDVIAPLDGRLARVVARHGKKVAKNDDLFVIEPEDGQLENAIIALSRCGTKDDIPALQPIKEGRFGASTPTQKLAESAIKELSKK